MSNYRSPAYFDAKVLGNDGRGVVYTHKGVLDEEYGGYQKFSENHLRDMGESDVEFMSLVESNGTVSYNYPSRLMRSSSGSATTIPSSPQQILLCLVLYTLFWA